MKARKNYIINILLVCTIILLAVWISGNSAVAQDQPWQGEVVAISDGDTIKVLHKGKAERIRLYGIDTPEMKQAFGKRAKQFTAEQVFRKTVKVVPMDTDRYGRTVAIVYPVDDRSISLNEAIVEVGFAWVYRKYCKAEFCDGWLEVEQTARKTGKGLWADVDPVPPWKFRRRK